MGLKMVKDHEGTNGFLGGYLIFQQIGNRGLYIKIMCLNF
jgi:hypothetical protein